MIAESKQGDIFEIGLSGDYQLILVFGHLGLNEMNVTWQNFKNKYPNLQSIENPFIELNTPSIIKDGKWIQFIAEQENHGLVDSILRNTFDVAFEWAQKQKLNRIITNGIMNTNHSTDTIKNRQSDDKRVKFIREICLEYKYKQLDITLVSLNDAYLRNE